MIIKRIIDGAEVSIRITERELELIRNADKIKWAQNILENYEECIVDFDSIMDNDDLLVKFAEKLEAKCLENNGEKEIEVIQELFTWED